MTPRFVATACVLSLAALLAGSIAIAETPTIYKWVDQNGVAHYTTDKGRIPSEVRTRVERVAPATTPPVAAAPHPEDEMRDAVRVKKPGSISAPPADPFPVTTPEAEPALPTASIPAPAPAPATEPAPEPAQAVEAAPATPAEKVVIEEEVVEETVVQEAPAPLAEDVPEPIDPVSSPPPAPVAPLEPTQSAEVAKLDTQIEALENQIASREEKLAALISTSDQQRATPLVDDPSFREISQRLPKLQAELQTLRERRNKILPPTP